MSPLPISFYNSLTRKVEPLIPLAPDGKTVTVYTCGPTVYNFAHIGNLRTYVWQDILVRTLKYFGYDVVRVMNVTDVDDKTIRDAQAAKIDFYEFTNRYTKAFFDDLQTLRIELPTHAPKATDFIPQMIEMIQQLIAKGHAYEIEGSVYYRVDSFSGYGKLSGRTKRGENRARIQADEYDEKEGVQDFALWKAAKPEDGDVKWESPWGAGRPGWHIECSVMSQDEFHTDKHTKNYFNGTLDIHCGGKEHLFPHHENEIAQSEGATGKKFVNVWLHGEWLNLEDTKMSKSLGNFYVLRDLIEKGFSPRAYRYFVSTANYRMPVTFSFSGLGDAAKRIEKFDEFWFAFERGFGDGTQGEVERKVSQYRVEFTNALADDINVARAYGIVFEFMREMNGFRSQGVLNDLEVSTIRNLWLEFDSILQVLTPWEEQSSLSETDIHNYIERRRNARTQKQFAEADAIRKELLEKGVILEDTPGGTIWRRK
ncbi:MAG: cysteine--tRNA ligase [bacterium]|nr:cysteine--tRNA ligase [bacterium]